MKVKENTETMVLREKCLLISATLKGMLDNLKVREILTCWIIVKSITLVEIFAFGIDGPEVMSCFIRSATRLNWLRPMSCSRLVRESGFAHVREYRTVSWVSGMLLSSMGRTG